MTTNSQGVNKMAKIIKKEEVYKGFNSLSKYTFEYESFDGARALTPTSEVFERRDSVAVLLYDVKQDSVVLIEQFRPGSFLAEDKPYALEVPAGLIDAEDKDPKQAAIRETKEEVGCGITDIVEIGSFYPEISTSKRRMYLFFGKINASNLNETGGMECEHEDIRIHLIKTEKLKELMNTGKINNSHTLIAVQWFFLNYSSLSA